MRPEQRGLVGKRGVRSTWDGARGNGEAARPEAVDGVWGGTQGGGRGQRGRGPRERGGAGRGGVCGSEGEPGGAAGSLRGMRTPSGNVGAGPGETLKKPEDPGFAGLGWVWGSGLASHTPAPATRAQNPQATDTLANSVGAGLRPRHAATPLHRCRVHPPPPAWTQAAPPPSPAAFRPRTPVCLPPRPPTLLPPSRAPTALPRLLLPAPRRGLRSASRCSPRPHPPSASPRLAPGSLSLGLC